MGVMIGLEFQDHLLQPSAFLLRTRTTYFSAADKHGESAKRGVSKPGKGERQGRTRGKILDAAMPSPAGSRRGAFLLWILCLCFLQLGSQRSQIEYLRENMTL